MQIVTLKHHLADKPTADDFAAIEAPLPTCPEDGVLAKVIYLSLDPYVGSTLRGRHMGHAIPEPMTEPILGAVIGRVIESKSARFQEGDLIHTMEGGWQEIVAVNANDARKLDANAAPLSCHAGVLGMPGLTAWSSMSQLARVKKGDVVLIDAAAGPVGGTAGQIAKTLGAEKVVGIAGGAEKCALVTDTYGFDACVDYKSENWRDVLQSELKDGLTVFHENVSADMAMLALTHARPYARGVLCGLVDAYHTEQQAQHHLNAGLIIGKRAQLFGLVVYDFYPRWDEFVAQAAPWINEGKLKYAEDRMDGLENAPVLFERLMNGKNLGKAVIKVSPEEG